jgi:pimeloyl-ACP methyl ester carboxylesterase/class 3 adenylate cyclase
MDVPETRYAKTSDGLNIAYQVVGAGPLDLVYLPSWVSHLEVFWEEPLLERFLSRLASFSRLILLDRRGTGLSDRVPADAIPPFEDRISDLLSVLDAVHSKRTAIFGSSEGGGMACLFAATHPERTSSLVLWGTYPRAIKDDEFPEGWLPASEVEAEIAETERVWTEGDFKFSRLTEGVSAVEEERVRRWCERLCRMAVSPGAAATYSRMGIDFDLRAVLPSIRVPTLCLVRSKDENLPATRYMAEHIPGSRFVELPGEIHQPAFGDQDAALEEIEEFLTGVRPTLDSGRVVLTVLFTDIVGSTELATKMGDRAWNELLTVHNARVRTELSRHHGNEIDTAGDGFFATFDGPARAVRCARAVVEGVQPLGLEIRAGVHTGEVDTTGEKVRGIAVTIGARIAAQAGPSEVFVSRTVKDLVAGSGLIFEDIGAHELKGIPDRWQLYRVVDGTTLT